jgi:hypothetical protein
MGDQNKDVKMKLVRSMWIGACNLEDTLQSGLSQATRKFQALVNAMDTLITNGSQNQSFLELENSFALCSLSSQNSSDKKKKK